MTDFKPGDRFIRHRKAGDKVYTRDGEGRWYLPNANWSFGDSDVERGMTIGDNWTYEPAEDEPQEPVEEPAPDEPESPVENTAEVPEGDAPETNPGPSVTHHKGFWHKFTE